MYKLILFICILILLPVFALASASPTMGYIAPISDPVIEYERVMGTQEWLEFVERLEDIEGFAIVDALKINLDQQYEQVEWTLSFTMTETHEPFVCLINNGGIITKDVTITDTGSIIIDFSDIEPDIYYLCFYIKTGV